jgi:hypothetical protein
LDQFCSSPFLKGHYNDIFLHLTVFHLQCNLIQPFHYHSQPLTFSFTHFLFHSLSLSLTFSFQSETVIFTFLDLQKYIYKTVGFSWVGKKNNDSWSFSYGFWSFPKVMITSVCCFPYNSVLNSIKNCLPELMNLS